MSKQTALQWFKDVAYSYLDKESKEYVDILFNHALQMEREQIISTFRDAQIFEVKEYPMTDVQYYNETYGGQDEK
jgi:hypothetical protein